MKTLTAMILALAGMTLATTSATAAESGYIPWTFDDFDSKGEVVETTGDQPVDAELAALEVGSITDEDAGELGW